MKTSINPRTPILALVLIALVPHSMVLAQTTVSVGSGTATNGEYPIRSASVGTYSQQIFLQSEIGQAGNIIGIRFYAESGGALLNSSQWTVWLNTTATTEFATFSDWKAQGNQRFNGTVTWPGDGQWMQIDFASAQNYANTQNLVLTVKEDGAGNNAPDGNAWGVYAAGQNRGMRNIASSTGTVGPTINGSRTSNINRIQLIFDSPCTPQTANAGAPLPDLCQGGSTGPLGGSVGGSATTGQWSSSQGGTFLPNANTLNATYTPPPGFSGAATLTLSSTNGCNAPATSSTTLLVLPTYAATDERTICLGESYVINGNSYTTAGTYTDVLLADNGCDSTVTTVLSVTDPDLDTSVGVSGIVLTATETEASYQWVDCGNGNAPILGAVTQSFSPTVNGSYAVELSSLECPNITLTTACQAVTSVGMVDQAGSGGIVLRPNPAKDALYIDGLSGTVAHAVVLDASGKVVLDRSLPAPGAVLDVQDLDPGMYILRLEGAKGPISARFVK